MYYIYIYYLKCICAIYIIYMYKALGPSHSSRATLANSHHTIANQADQASRLSLAHPALAMNLPRAWEECLAG
jgi:hypothetical protein